MAIELYVFREKVSDLRSDRFVSLLESINELEQITKNNMLDIEFAIDNNLNVHILQVRSISTHDSWDENISKVSKNILEIKNIVSESYQPKSNLFGNTSLPKCQIGILLKLLEQPQESLLFTL